ncbi:MAG: CNNM domain-containing protein [Kiritimatiellae bacterium]|nr:CNNM domain-containing protein [Kiritimatiellia bacterium]
MLLFIAVVLFTVVMSFICSLSEASLLSLSSADIARISEKRPKTAEIMRGFRNNIQKPIAVILITNTLANTMGASVAGSLFGSLFGSKLILVFSIVLSYVIIQWSEILPKSLGVRFNRQVACLIAGPLQKGMAILNPFTSFIEWMNRPFLSRGMVKSGHDTIGDISVLARFAFYNKLITSEQEGIVARSLKLSQTAVRDIMVAREEIKYLSTDMSLADALIEAHLHHHTRYILVNKGNLDEVLGYVNVKDIVSALQTNPKDPSLKGISRPIPVIKSSQFATELLKSLTKSYQHIALVHDADGRTAGLITIEDVVEAIVGDMEDEYDILPAYVYRLSDVRFIVGGGASLELLKSQTGFDLPDEGATVNDLLLGLVGTGLPAVEKKIAYKDIVFIIRKMRRSKIHEVMVEGRPQV